MEAVFSAGSRPAGNRSSRALASNCIQFSILYLFLWISLYVNVSMEILLLVWLQACIDLSKHCHGNNS